MVMVKIWWKEETHGDMVKVIMVVGVWERRTCWCYWGWEDDIITTKVSIS